MTGVSLFAADYLFKAQIQPKPS